MTTPLASTRSGLFFAIAGTAFLVLALAQTLLACLPLIQGLAEHGVSDATLAGEIVGELIVTMVVRSLHAMPALMAILLALMMARYRSPWFAWTTAGLCLPLGLLFPLGTGFALFLLVYLLKHRREFAGQRSAPPAHPTEISAP